MSSHSTTVLSSQTYHRESFAKAQPELRWLAGPHWHEVAHYKDIPLDVDWQKYEELDKSGNLRLFTVRSGENLVGYSLFFIHRNLHYKASIQAVQDVIFILKHHRGRGKEFIKWCDDQLREEGVQVVYQHLKAAHNWGAMLERIGYELMDLIYARRLDTWR